jgi:3-hydroxyacyl-[acyl-carrier-protein] dehydratase
MNKDPDLSAGLYRIDEIVKQNNLVKATVLLNPSHKVFRGHFPGNPILPGVFNIQILEDIAENISGKKLMLSKADSIKFMSFIKPESNSTLIFEVTFSDTDESIIKFNCSVSSGITVFCRIKGELRAE